MKTILISLVVLLSTTHQCDQRQQVKQTDSKDFSEIREFRYKNHDYIWFRKSPGSKYESGGIVHDPNCYYCSLPD